MNGTKRVILVTGSREPRDGLEAACSTALALLQADLQRWPPEDTLVVHGAAPGWDTAFDRAALELGIHRHPMPADWDRYRDRKPNPAGFIRNERMVRWVCELAERRATLLECWAFANAWQSGTGHCARLARKASIYVEDFGVSTAEPGL